jgi:hypothetical protein
MLLDELVSFLPNLFFALVILGLAFGLGGRDKAREIIDRVSRAEKK